MTIVAGRVGGPVEQGEVETWWQRGIDFQLYLQSSDHVIQEFGGIGASVLPGSVKLVMVTTT